MRSKESEGKVAEAELDYTSRSNDLRVAEIDHMPKDPRTKSRFIISHFLLLYVYYRVWTFSSCIYGCIRLTANYRHV